MEDDVLELVRRATSLEGEISCLIHDVASREAERAAEALEPEVARTMARIDARRGDWPADERVRAALDHACRAYRMVHFWERRENPRDYEYRETHLYWEAMRDLNRLLGREDAAEIWARHERPSLRGASDRELTAHGTALAKDVSAIVRELGPEPWRDPSPGRTQAAMRLSLIAEDLRKIGRAIAQQHPMYLPMRRAARALWLLREAGVSDVAHAWSEVERAARALRSAAADA